MLAQLVWPSYGSADVETAHFFIPIVSSSSREGRSSPPHQEWSDRAISQFGSVLRVDEEVWSGNRLTFRVTALHQAANGTVDIEDDHARIEIALPWLLAQLASRIQDTFVRCGTLLLDKDKPK